jgi:hypothetical protein
VQVGFGDGQSSPVLHATYDIAPARQASCGWQLTEPVKSGFSFRQQAIPVGQSLGMKHGKSIFSQWSDSNIPGSMQAALAGDLVRQQTLPSVQTSDPHVTGPSDPASLVCRGDVKSQRWFDPAPPLQQPAIAAAARTNPASTPAARRFARPMPPSVTQAGKIGHESGLPDYGNAAKKSYIAFIAKHGTPCCVPL